MTDTNLSKINPENLRAALPSGRELVRTLNVFVEFYRSGEFDAVMTRMMTEIRKREAEAERERKARQRK